MFEFVTVSHPKEVRDHKREKRIRQHAIRNGIQNKRKEEAKRNENFVTVDIDARTGKLRKNAKPENAVVMAKQVSGGLLDPFDSLPGDGERLRSLMAHTRSNAIQLETPYGESTTGTIGINVDSDVVAHRIRGIQSLKDFKNVLKLTESAHIPVSSTIRRALFWQDLYSCLFVGTLRLLSHHDYEEFTCEKVDSSAPGYYVPSGFERVKTDFPVDFIDIVRDLNALCAAVDKRCTRGGLPIKEYPIDNFQYSIESRLVDLLSQNRSSGAEDYILQACIFAIFLCTYKLSTGIWEGCFIPEYCATQIISLLSKTKGDPRWKQREFKELLLWLLFVSGAMANRNRVRSRAIKTIRSDCYDLLKRMHDEWDTLEHVLRTFIWSNLAMEQNLWQFWQEMHSPQKVNSRMDEKIPMHPV
ncbi:hypothetical protein N0V90_001921 [Kalmusia sp. IMI 367209]|nr:hypothetical protein N0V90_001921 [Kalmusia sp. IMI 367209]